MVTQPQFVIFALQSEANPEPHSPWNRVPLTVYIRPEHYFGTTKHWATKQEFAEISDLERTVIDGLRQPEYCGGITEVAKGLWMQHQDMHPAKIVDYALRLDVGAVIRRLGYLLELYAIASEERTRKIAGHSHRFPA